MRRTGGTFSQDYEDKVIEGHSYDGIMEYDNPMPRWWTLLFIFSVIFAVLYSAYYLTDYGPTKEQEYAMAKEEFDAMMKANMKPNSSNFPELKDLVTFAKNDEIVGKGRVVFSTQCTPCHGPEGGGIIGPNLTDDLWIHGGSLDSIYKTIRDGVLEKGMVAWKEQLSVEEMMQVASFVRSIQGTHKPGRDPQGEKSDPTPLD